MIWTPTETQRKLESKILAEISKDELWKHVEHLCSIGEKFAGSPEEKKACDYFVKSVKEYGVPIEVYEFDSFLSYGRGPGDKAELSVTYPENFSVKCQSHAMSGSMPLIEEELVDVGAGESKDYEGKEVKGKVVLVDFAALWAPERLYIAQEKGAKAQITISGDPVIHDMVVTTIWGTPTRESSARIPKIPIVSVTNEDGRRLRELCKRGPVKVKMMVEVWRGWKKVRLPIVTIKGAEEPDKYFLIGGHYCSWGDGMTDNVGGDAIFIEMAKIFWKYRDQLKRGVKIAWWPGHSQGRYSGSTWFADNFWEDLNKNCVACMIIDSPGVKGATRWSSHSSSDLYQFNKQNTEEYSKDIMGEKIPVRHSTMVSRSGDQSFTGIGLSSLGSGSGIPADSPLRGKTTGGSGGGWWWHSLNDTIDKGDKDLLPLPMKMGMINILKVCNSPILPVEFEPVADDYLQVSKELNEGARGMFDVSPLINRAEELKVEAKNLEQYLSKLMSRYEKFETEEDKERFEEVFKAINESLLKMTRILISTFNTQCGRFEQDPAIRIPPLPVLQPIKELATLDPKTDDARFLKTGLIRERNKVIDSLDRAIDIAKVIQSIKV